MNPMYLVLMFFALIFASKSGRSSAFKMIVSLYDMYLNFKYRNYSYRQTHQELRPYHLICFKVFNRLNPENSLLLKPQDVGLPENVDFTTLEEKSTIAVDVGRLLAADKEGKLSGQRENLMVYVYYKYLRNIYILPVDPKQAEFTLPPYDFLDLESAMVTEYTATSADQPVNLVEFAGPKGNFYTDTKYTMHPRDMIDEDTGKPVTSLELTTTMGMDYKFATDEAIQVHY